LGLAQVSWATARIGVHHLSLRLPYIDVFPFTLLHLSLAFFRVSSLRLTHLHPFRHSIDPSLADGEFPGLGLALVPDVVVSEDGVRMKQKSRFKFQPWPGFELRTSQYNGRERYY